MTFGRGAFGLKGAFVFGTAPRYVILNLIQDPCCGGVLKRTDWAPTYEPRPVSIAC